MSDIEAPTGVRLRYANGKKVECQVTRAPKKDVARRGGKVFYFEAQPVGDVDPALTYQLEVDRWPPKTGISVVFPENIGKGDLLNLMDTSIMQEPNN